MGILLRRETPEFRQVRKIMTTQKKSKPKDPSKAGPDGAPAKKVDKQGPDGKPEKTKTRSAIDKVKKMAGDITGKKEPDTVASLSDRLLRLQADFDNFRKRTVRERQELYKRANEELMEEILPALDHLEIALESAGTHEVESSFLEGVRMVGEQMSSTLGRFGLKPIDADGEVFDHKLHEAISHIPSDDVAENVVITQTRRGYVLNDQLLRAAQVVVSSGAKAEE
jgi:molecular chaperone GrpE